MRLLAALGSYVFALAIARGYGAGGMGVYSLTVTLLTILGTLAGMGFGYAAVRLVPQYITEGRPDRLRHLYRLILRWALPASFVLGACLFAAASPVAGDLFHDPALAAALRVAGVVLPLFVMLRIHTEIVRGFKNLALSEFMRDAHIPLAGAGFLVLLRLAGCGVHAPVLSYALGIASGCLVAMLYVASRILRLPPGSDPSLSSRELAGISLPMMMGDVLGWRIDLMLIVLFASTQAVGLYDVPFRLAVAVSLLLGPINAITAPKIAELFWSGNMEGLKRVIRMTSRIMFWSSAFVLLVLLAAPGFWLRLFGKEFRAGYPVLILLAVGQFVSGANGTVGCFLNMTGNHRIFRNITVMSIVANILLSCLLIPLFGITGAAEAFMVTMILWNASAAAWIWRRFRIRTFYIPLLMH